jgi:hypothetical protein
MIYMWDFYRITMNDLGTTLLDDVTTEVTKAGAKVVIAKTIENRQAIGQKLKHHFKKFVSNRLGSINISTYMTWFGGFKAEYSIEEVNQSVALLLNKYRSDEIKEDGIKYKDIEFTIALEFTYSDRVYLTSESLDCDFEDGQIIIPAVNGLSVYIIPQDSNQIKSQLFAGHALIEEIEKEVLKKYHLRAKGRFIYIETENISDKNKILEILQDKATDWEGSIRNISWKDNEIKLRLDTLIAKSIGEIL